jgi:PAS domain S-box-containing protein
MDESKYAPIVQEVIGRSPVVVFIWRQTEGWPVEFVSKNVAQFGYAPGDFYSDRLKYLDLIHPDDRARVVAEVGDVVANGHGEFAQEYRLLTADGEVRFVEERTRTRRDAQGHVTHLEGVVFDVTVRRNAEHQLREQLHFLQVLLDAIPMPVYYKGLDGRYQGCNRAFAEMAGRPSSEIIGRSVFEVWPAQFAETYRRRDREVFDHPGVQVYEDSVPWADGSIRDMVFNRATYHDSSGAPMGIVGVLDDATNRKNALRLLREAREALEARVQERTSELVHANDVLSKQIAERIRAEQRLGESERKYRELADSLPQTVFEMDSEGRLTWVNRNASRMFGHPRESLENRMRVYDLIAEPDRARAKASLDRALVGEEVDGDEYLAVREDGSSFPVMASARPISTDGGLVGVRGIFVDITERVAVERMKTEFLSVASHELRTPLTPLRLLIQQSRRRLARGEPVRAEVLERMERQARRMADMVNDLLDVSRLERGTLAVHPIRLDLRSAVLAMVEDFRHQFPGRVIELKQPDEPVEINADLTRIEQVVSNLIDNAIKYAPESPIRVTVAAEEGTARIVIADEGPGIGPEDRAGLFTRFYRIGPASSRTQKGLGLGLYICREIVERHGGQIDLQTTDRGTTFVVTLPRLAPEEPATAS